MLIVYDVGPAALFATTALPELKLYFSLLTRLLQWHLYNLCIYVPCDLGVTCCCWLPRAGTERRRKLTDYY